MTVRAVGLASVLVLSSWKPGVVFLIIFVTAYDSAALFAFYRGSDSTVIWVARGVGVLDVCSFFLMLWTFGPTPPGALIACYIALLNVAVALGQSPEVLAIGIDAIHIAVAPNEHDRFPVRCELRNEALGMIGRQFQRFAAR